MTLILGSQSPRRKEILEYFSIPFILATPLYDEDVVPFDGDPKNYVAVLSKGKSDSLSAQFPHGIILTADTTVARDGKIYGKPKDKEEAYQILSELAGKWHSVFTGVTVRHKEKFFTHVEETKVLLNSLNSQQIHKYIAHTQWSDKAGGYAIQGKGGIIVKRIEGCYYNVKGLPINTVEALLKHFGIELWDYL